MDRMGKLEKRHRRIRKKKMEEERDRAVREINEGGKGRVRGRRRR